MNTLKAADLQCKKLLFHGFEKVDTMAQWYSENIFDAMLAGWMRSTLF
jgi:hypothetical protein